MDPFAILSIIIVSVLFGVVTGYNATGIFIDDEIDEKHRPRQIAMDKEQKLLEIKPKPDDFNRKLGRLREEAIKARFNAISDKLPSHFEGRVIKDLQQRAEGDTWKSCCVNVMGNIRLVEGCKFDVGGVWAKLPQNDMERALVPLVALEFERLFSDNKIAFSREDKNGDVIFVIKW